MKDVVRISEIHLKNFKNVRDGVIQMPSVLRQDFFSPTADIIGIYGQNGSGKTAIVDALSFVQLLLSGKPLPVETEQYILKGEDTAVVSVQFAIQSKGQSAIVFYSVALQRTEDKSFCIQKEKLEYKSQAEAECTDESEELTFESRKMLLQYMVGDNRDTFAPKKHYDAFLRAMPEYKLHIAVAKKLAEKTRSSFIFNEENLSLLKKASENGFVLSPFVEALYKYATVNLFVISNEHASSIGMNFLLPFAFRLEEEGIISKGDLAVRLDEPTVYPKENFEMLKQIISSMNTVLGTIIPGLSLEIYNFGEELLENQQVGYKFELLSRREDVVIPLKYESEGIVKIISILNALMCVYNNPSMCLALDEMDAGIFEYLLGELLDVFQKGAKGQLIFTSHNLRVLELLEVRNLIFSTTNPNNRYIRVKNIKSNNNLRDVYLRSIILGGQKENLYTETNSASIGRAFRRVGKAVLNGC